MYVFYKEEKGNFQWKSDREQLSLVNKSITGNRTSCAGSEMQSEEHSVT